MSLDQCVDARFPVDAMIEHRSANWAGVHEQTPALLKIRAKLSGIFAWHHGEITVELFCQVQAIRPRQCADGFENLANGHGPLRIPRSLDWVSRPELGSHERSARLQATSPSAQVADALTHESA